MDLSFDDLIPAGDASAGSGPARITVRPQSGAGLNPRTRDVVIRTVYGEASAEPDEGLAGVAAVIRNRAQAGRYGGSDPAAVVFAPNQFEPWQRPDARNRMMSLKPGSPDYDRIGRIVDGVFSGEINDPTGGMTHFFAPEAQAALGRRDPAWARGEGLAIGRHTFFAPEGRVAMTDVSAQSKQPAADLSFDDLIPAAQPEKPAANGGINPQDQSSIPAFIRDIPKEIAGAAGEAVDNLKGFDPRGLGEMGPIDGLLRTGKALLGVPQLVMSPITGAARSLIGHPMADLTHTVGEVIAPETAAKDNPDQMYEQAKGNVDIAVSAAMPGRAPAPVAVRATPPLTAGQEAAVAGSRLSEAGMPVDVPRAIASDSVATQRVGQGIRNVPIVGDAIPAATARLSNQLEGAVADVAGQFGGGSGPNVAHRIGQQIGSAADAETLAARTAAQRSDNAVLRAWEDSQVAANQQIAQIEGAALARARQSVGDMSPQDMGEMLIARLRAGEREAFATKERLYGVAGETDGSIAAESVNQVRGRVAQHLEDQGRVIDNTLTPASARMLDELQRFSTLNIENRAVGARLPSQGEERIAAVNMFGIEQVRKRLNAMSQAATNDADRAAGRMIIREFDNWLGDAFDNALFSGSDASLQAWRAARAANADWRTRYGFNARDDADRIVNRVVTGEVTPQEVANWVVGATKVGASGQSSRLLTRIVEATAGDPEAIGAIRGGVWNRLSQTTDGATPKTPERIANDINEFLGGSGRDVARRLFSDQQQQLMRGYAQTLRVGVESRHIVADVGARTRPDPMEVGVGPFQKLANDLLGKGGRSDEALFSAINSYAKSGAKGDIDLLSRILRVIPDRDRGDLASAIVRQLGVSPRTGQFSPDVFISSWNTYSPQAKSLLFGMSGPQRTALDDIAKISLRMKEIGSRFGNPSGTAQNVNLVALASAAVAAPIQTLTAALGGLAVARILSAPVGASSIAKWAKAYEAATVRPTQATIAAYKRASSLLAANISLINGNPIKETILRLSAPAPVHAEQDQRGAADLRQQ